jgi:hypothetical protein
VIGTGLGDRLGPDYAKVREEAELLAPKINWSCKNEQRLSASLHSARDDIFFKESLVVPKEILSGETFSIIIASFRISLIVIWFGTLTTLGSCLILIRPTGRPLIECFSARGMPNLAVLAERRAKRLLFFFKFRSGISNYFGVERTAFKVGEADAVFANILWLIERISRNF